MRLEMHAKLIAKTLNFRIALLQRFFSMFSSKIEAYAEVVTFAKKGFSMGVLGQLLRPYDTWPFRSARRPNTIFPDPAMTLAAVDRLVHHATIFEMNVESYRRKAAQKAKGPGRPAQKATQANTKPD